MCLINPDGRHASAPREPGNLHAALHGEASAAEDNSTLTSSLKEPTNPTWETMETNKNFKLVGDGAAFHDFWF
jgi:hypothetical protein